MKKFLKAKARKAIEKMMASVTGQHLDQERFPDGNMDDFDPKTNTCGGSFCAGGHMILANKPKVFARLLKQEAQGLGVDWEEEALKVMGLNYDNTDPTAIFLNATDWPMEFRTMYYEATKFKTEKARNKRRLKAFLARWRDVLTSDGADIRRSC